jgi:hypothetical protein
MIAGMSLGMNTFSSLIFLVSVVMLLGTTMEAHLSRQERKVGRTMLQWIVFYHMMMIFVNCVVIVIHREHLMLWAIFAPKVKIFLFLFCF